MSSAVTCISLGSEAYSPCATPCSLCSACVVVKIILFQLHIAILYKLVFSFSGVVVLVCVLNIANTFSKYFQM